MLLFRRARSVLVCDFIEITLLYKWSTVDLPLGLDRGLGWPLVKEQPISNTEVVTLSPICSTQMVM